METLSSVEEVRRHARAWRCAAESIVLVPTMGNLHEGHLRLVEVAQETGARVVVSIFINAMQFGQNEDFATYPRMIEEDIQKLSGYRVDLVFHPEPQAVYPRPLTETTRVVVPELSDVLCGAVRPGHFTGVTTVVSILFHIVQPDKAVFGEKDYQQLLLVRRMVADLHMPVEIIAVPTVRAEDGLALSSRNNYLSAQERPLAARLYDSLCKARDMICQGNDDYRAIERASRERLKAGGFRVDYFAIRRGEDLSEPAPGERDVVILAAAWLGKARLIDNIRVSLKN